MPRKNKSSTPIQAVDIQILSDEGIPIKALIANIVRTHEGTVGTSPSD